MGWKLPFVGRLAFELLQTENARLQAELEKEQKRSADLLETILDLKLAGAAAPRRTKSAVTLTPRPRSAIQQAIDENPLASSNPRLRAHLSDWAAKELAKRPDEIDEDEWEARVIDRLRTWHLVGEHDDDGDDRDEVDELLDGDDDESAIQVG